MTTRHVQAIDDLNEITSSRECYLQILSMTIVASQEKNDNGGEDNDSIRHLLAESSRMETRLIELCGESFEDIRSGTEEQRDELFNNADYTKKIDMETTDDEEQTNAKISKVTQVSEEQPSYLESAARTNHSIRMRMSLRGQQRHMGIEARAKETKRICVELLNGVCHFDDNAKLTTWNDFGPEAGLRDLDILTNETIVKFLDTPKSGPLKGEMHSIGIRIVTEMKPETCTRNWNKFRWKSTFTNLIRLREAESQSPVKAYAIGHIQGTSPNGDYTTMKNEIKMTTENKAEASWQMFNIPNVSSKMWNVAKFEARNAVGDDRSPEFKRKKFALSPEGLTIYVNKYENIKPVKKHLIEKYGRRTPFNDGSIARFIPYVHGRVKDRKVIDDKLFTIVKTHCTTKAAEVTLPIDVLDIHEQKDYLGGKSIEQLIHEIKDEKGDRVFNHIGHRWNTEYNSNKYVVTASESKLIEAQKAVDELKNTLHNLSNPPERIFSHFVDAQKGRIDVDEQKRKRNESAHDDDDAQTYYDREDDCGNEERRNLPPYAMHIVLDDKENDDASSMGFSTATKSVGSTKKGILKRSNVGMSDDDDSMESTNTAFTNKSGVSARSVTFDVLKTYDIIGESLIKKGIAIERYKAWKDANSKEFEFILRLHSTTPNRVRGIKKILSKWTGTAEAGKPSSET